MKPRMMFTFYTLVILSLSSGCSLLGSQAEPSQDPGVAYTQAAETIIAGLTQLAPVSTPTQLLPLATDTLVPTPTLQPVLTDTPTTTATPLPTSTPSAEKVLFEEDFEGRTSWYTEENDRFSLDFQNDGYVIRVDIAHAPIWSVRNKDYEDIALEVDAARLDGPEDGYFGLLCRQETEEDFYLFLISSSGNYGIGKVENGDFEFIEEGSDSASVIHGGDVINRVRAECNGETLTLTVNGQQLLEVEDDDFVSGDIGVVVKTESQIGLEVFFDNFTILEID